MTRGPDGADMVCPLCERPLPRHARQSVHHLIPKLKGGAKGPTVRLHEIRHRTIHKNLTETELARTYNTIEALRAQPDIAAFIAWVARKDPTFHAPTRGAKRKGR